MKKSGVLTFDLSTHSLPASDGSWMLVFPAGTTKARDGRGPFHLKDKAAMQAVIDRTLEYFGNTEVMVDYDHHLDKIDQPGATAKAAGWVKKWEARDEGVFAFISWTPAASKAITDQEYRYLSPLFFSDDKGNVHKFLNISLVNTPALDLEAIAASAEQRINTREKDTPMEFMKKLAKKLGLEDSASEQAIMAAIAKLEAPKDNAKAVAAAVETSVAEALKPIALAAGLKDGEAITAEDLAAKVKGIADAKASTGDENKVITALQAELGNMATELNAMKAATGTKEATAFIDNAIKEGRVGVKPLRDHYIERFAASPEGAKAVQTEIAAFPTVSGTTINTPPPADKDGKVALSADQSAIAEQLGISPEDMQKTIASEQASA